MTNKRKNIGAFLGVIMLSCAFMGCETIGVNLIIAAETGNLGKVQRFIQRGADINYTHYQYGGPPLIHAVGQGHLDVVKYLVERGANVNLRHRWNGGTALIYGAYNGHLEIVKYLVEKGADINLRANNGDSALSVAYDQGYMNIYNYLKGQGAIEFAPKQNAPASSGSGSSSSGSSSSNSDPMANANAIKEVLASPLENGTYTLSGTNVTISISSIGKSGILFYTPADRKGFSASYSINGNRMTINLPTGAAVYIIQSKTSFSGPDGLWVKTGF